MQRMSQRSVTDTRREEIARPNGSASGGAAGGPGAGSKPAFEIWLTTVMDIPLPIRGRKLHAKMLHNESRRKSDAFAAGRNANSRGCRSGKEAMRDNREQWPSELRLRENGRILSVSFENGDSYDLSAEYLRVMSPSAEVQGHRREERLIIGGKRHCRGTGTGPAGTHPV